MPGPCHVYSLKGEKLQKSSISTHICLEMKARLLLQDRVRNKDFHTACFLYHIWDLERGGTNGHSRCLLSNKRKLGSLTLNPREPYP